MLSPHAVPLLGGRWLPLALVTSVVAFLGVQRAGSLAVERADTSQGDLIPRAVLFGDPQRTGVRISPDGKRLSWAAPRNGVLNLWVAPVGALDQARPITDDRARPIRDYRWAYTGRHLLYLQDTAGDENFHIFRVDVDDGETVDLTPYPGARAHLAAISPDQPTAAMVAINDRDPSVFDVYKLDVSTGKRTLVVQNTDGFSGFVLDHDMNVRLARKMLPDGSIQQMVAETRSVHPRWKLFDTIPFDDAATTGVVGFAPDGDTMYTVESRGRNTAALVSIDLATRRSTVIAEDPRADVSNAIVDPVRGTLQAVEFEYQKPSWKVLDRSIEPDLDRLAALDGGQVYIMSRTLDDQTWVVGTTSDQQPARYYLWDRTRQRGTLLFTARPELEHQPLAPMTPVEITARDGLTLVSYLSLPASAARGRDGRPSAALPMVLLVHGGPWSRDHWGYHALHQLLANRGYAVLSVNYRGSTGFGKKFVNAANLEWGRAMHDDLLDAVAWAISHGVTTKDRVCIMGGSYGGYATLVGMAMTPDVFRCGVDIVGPSNLLTFLATIPSYWAPTVALWHQRMGDPRTLDGRARLVAASPLTYAAHIRRPLLIAQGANDPRVKQAESDQIVAAMKAHRLPVTYAVFPDEGHGFARPENNIAFLGATEAFLSVHLGGRYQPLTRAELDASTMEIREGRDGIPDL